MYVCGVGGGVGVAAHSSCLWANEGYTLDTCKYTRVSLFSPSRIAIYLI